MSDGIQGGRGPVPPELHTPALPEERTPTGASPLGKKTKASPLDKFERAQSSGNAVVPPGVQKPQVSTQSPTNSVRATFSSEEMAALANAFAAVIRQHPNASRSERAKNFSRAVLKRSKLKKLFGKLSEAELEQMCDNIGDALGDSPVFGQLIDDISEEAGKQGS